MGNKKYRSLFITYDGLTDPLGQSQILPYIIGLSNSGYILTILSCEKEDRYQDKKELIQSICAANGIKWVPLFFHKKPPILAKYYDIYNLKRNALKLYKKFKYDIIHCRSYISAEIGMELKKTFGCKYLFDMRGFWVDERVDGGLWDLKSPFYRIAYKYYKKKEGKLIASADHIISLTEAGKNEIKTWQYYNRSIPITVIPCSADFDLFTLSDQMQKIDARNQLEINQNDFVLSYLGSLGTWYLLDEMIMLFKTIKRHYKNSIFLIVTPDKSDQIWEKAENMGLKKTDFKIRFVERKQVPFIMKASDVSVSFIKPAYSKIASSPTKLGELLALGIPVICNHIGDVKDILQQSGGGFLVKDFSEASFDDVVMSLPHLLSLNKAEIRSNIYDYYALPNAINKYSGVYQSLLNN